MNKTMFRTFFNKKKKKEKIENLFESVYSVAENYKIPWVI